MKKHNKIKLAVLISIISIVITIISLIFSVYVGLKDVEYKDYIKTLQLNSQNLQQGNIEFQQIYDKINLAEKSISDTINNCQEINKDELKNNLKFLTDARTALIHDDYTGVSSNLNKINQYKICEIESKPGQMYWEVGIFSFIWLLLIITLIKVLKR